MAQEMHVERHYTLVVNYSMLSQVTIGSMLTTLQCMITTRHQINSSAGWDNHCFLCNFWPGQYCHSQPLGHSLCVTESEIECEWTI